MSDHHWIRSAVGLIVLQRAVPLLQPGNRRSCRSACVIVDARAEFLRQYREAVDVAHDPLGYGRLQRLLHAWRLAVIAIGRVGYYEELAAVRNGTAQTTPAEEAFPDWQQRLAAARAQTR